MKRIGHGFTRIKRMVADLKRVIKGRLGGLSLGLIVFAGLVLMAATLPVTDLKVFNSAKTASTSITQDGTRLAIDTGIAVTGASTFDDDVAVDGDTFFVDASTNRVGVSASATPDEALLCVGDDTDDVAGQQMLRLNIARPWVFEQVGAGSGAMLNLRSLSINKAFAVSTDGQFLIRDADGSQTSAFQVLPASGRVGINKFPIFAFDVAGDAAVSGDLNVGCIVTVGDFLKITPQSAAPTTPVEGWVYYDTEDHILYVYNGTTWAALN